MFSTLEDGKIVKGLSGVPDEGPVLYVGYHMLLGFELTPLVDEFLSQKGILLRGIAHPELFTAKTESTSSEFTIFDWVKIFGAVPVSASNLYKLLSTKSHVLLYPGGAREALHYKVHQSLSGKKKMEKRKKDTTIFLCSIYDSQLFYALTFPLRAALTVFL